MLDSVCPWIERFKARLQSMEHINRRSARREYGFKNLGYTIDGRVRIDGMQHLLLTNTTSLLDWWLLSHKHLISCTIWKERNSRVFANLLWWLVERYAFKERTGSRRDILFDLALLRGMLVRFVQRKDTLHFLVFWGEKSIPVWILHVQDEPIWKQAYSSFGLSFRYGIS